MSTRRHVNPFGAKQCLAKPIIFIYKLCKIISNYPRFPSFRFAGILRVFCGNVFFVQNPIVLHRFPDMFLRVFCGYFEGILLNIVLLQMGLRLPGSEASQ